MRGGLLALILLAALAQTAWCNLSVVGGLAREKAADPSESYEGTIELRNDSTSPCEVRIYQTDYSFLATGETFYLESGSSSRSNALWLSVITQLLITTWRTGPAISSPILTAAEAELSRQFVIVTFSHARAAPSKSRLFSEMQSSPVTIVQLEIRTSLQPLGLIPSLLTPSIRLL